jgi:hypothetical protein
VSIILALWQFMAVDQAQIDFILRLVFRLLGFCLAKNHAVLLGLLFFGGAGLGFARFGEGEDISGHGSKANEDKINCIFNLISEMVSRGDDVHNMSALNRNKQINSYEIIHTIET